MAGNFAQKASSFAKRVIKYPFYRYRKFIGWKQTKSITSKILDINDLGLAREDTLLEGKLCDYLIILLSYKITNTERLGILSVVLKQLAQDMANANISLTVIDASEDEYLQHTKRMFDNLGMPVSFTADSKPLCQAYLEMLQACNQKHFYLQFDDQITVGLKPSFLEASCQLLEMYEGLVNVVCLVLPLKVNVSEAEKLVDVVGFQLDKSSQQTSGKYMFGIGKDYYAPICLEKIGDYEFGIFENFQYGFFFNHLIAPVRDYSSRVQWYMDNVSNTSVHAIEVNAAGKIIGPFFHHIAICLSDVSFLDLDYSHTDQSVRAEGQQNKLVYEALSKGYALKASHLKKG